VKDSLLDQDLKSLCYKINEGGDPFDLLSQLIRIKANQKLSTAKTLLLMKGDENSIIEYEMKKSFF
jgi:hypothetical protein